MSRLSRARRDSRTLVALLVLFCLFGLVWASWGGGTETVPGSHNATRCLPWHRPRTVADLNRMIDGYRHSKDFLGADVGADVRLTDGRTLWLFGDTMRSPEFRGPQFVRNSMLIFTAHCAGVVMPKERGAVIPDRDTEVGYWPMSAVVVRRYGIDIVGIGAQRVRSTGQGPFDFEVLGPAVALFTVHRDRTPQLMQVKDIGPDDPARSRPMWGAALARRGRTLYIYGTANPGNAFGYSLRVARARIDTVLNQRTWRYWDGVRWVRRAGRAAAVIPAQGGVSQVLSVFRQGGAWYALSKRDEFLGHDLIVWKAPTPTGPFVPSAPVAEIPSNTHGGLLRYMPLAHPDLPPPLRQPGGVVVSYSRNVADPAEILRHPERYRPRFLRVPLP